MLINIYPRDENFFCCLTKIKKKCKIGLGEQASKTNLIINKKMNIDCNYNESTGDITCVLPENFSVMTKQDNYFEVIDAGGGENFVIQKFCNYGDLLISFFLFLIFLFMLLKTIYSFWFSRSIRIKKYEL